MPLTSGATTSIRETFIKTGDKLSDIVLPTAVILCSILSRARFELWSCNRILNSQSRLLFSAVCLNQGVRQDILQFSPKALT
ncbi:hypothetical protein KCU59_g107, partial [Aureobasidium melanogenum]